MVLFCLFVEILSVGTMAATQMSRNIGWFEHLAKTLAAGQRVVPANDGPNDFKMFWAADRMAAEGRAAELYDTDMFRAFQIRTRTFSAPWIYPPPVILITSILRFTGFGAGFLVWTFILTAGAIIVLWRARIPWVVIGATLIAPATIWNFNLGQLGLISGALLIAALAWATKRPAAAGIAAGLLTMKPQMGLLLPVVFVARWRLSAVLVAVVTFAALVVLTLAVYGPGVWTAYFHGGLSTARTILVGSSPPNNPLWGISIFWMARSFGYDVTASYMAQGAGAVVAAVWCWWVWRDPAAAPLPRIALTTCLAAFVTPYGYIDDLCAFSLGIALLAWNRRAVRPFDLLFWAWPAFCFEATYFLHVLIGPIVVFLAAIYAHVEMKRDAPGRGRIEEVLRDVAAQER